MSYYLVMFDRKGSAPNDAAQKVMIEVTGVSSAQDRADVVAKNGGGDGAIVQIFNELGLVSTRTRQGVWGRR